MQVSNGGNIYLEYLFDAENYTDFIYRYEVVKQLTNYNSTLIDELEALILDLQSEVGKLSEKLNEALVKDHGSFTKITKTKAAISLGDILNNVCNIAYDLGFSMNDIIGMNITKHNMEVEKKIKEQEAENNKA